MIVTEKEAATKFCHRTLSTPLTQVVDSRVCSGSQCMAWKWITGGHPIPTRPSDVERETAAGYVVCPAQAGQKNPYPDGIWMWLDPEKRTGCCGLVYATD